MAAGDVVLVGGQSPCGAIVLRRARAGGRKIDVATVATPDGWLRPHAAASAGPPDDRVGVAGTLLFPAEVVTVEEVDIPALACRDGQIRRTGAGPELARQEEDTARSQVEVVRVEGLFVLRNEEVVDGQLSVATHGEP